MGKKHKDRVKPLSKKPKPTSPPTDVQENETTPTKPAQRIPKT